MKIVASVALLYGREYLGYAIRSVIDAVDELHVLYTPVGSHGFRTAVPCPESREELADIAQQAAGRKLRWHERSDWYYEGQQRDSIFTYVPNADIILVVDADEIWPEESVNAALNFYETAHKQGCPRYRLSMLHYWRSFYKACFDPSFPLRVFYPQFGHLLEPPFTEGHIPTSDTGRISHFGYAQTCNIVGWKWLVHGHSHELRHDVSWFQEVYVANRQTDCHPVMKDIWTPVTVDPWRYLPAWMREHPYANMEIIP